MAAASSATVGENGLLSVDLQVSVSKESLERTMQKPVEELKKDHEPKANSPIKKEVLTDYKQRKTEMHTIEHTGSAEDSGLNETGTLD